MTDTLLAVNTGSSSLKYALYPIQGQQLGSALLKGHIQGLSLGTAPTDSLHQALEQLAQHLTNTESIRAVAHRVVHGGAEFTNAVVVNDQVLAQLSTLCALAPLHQLHNLAGIRAFQRRLPQALPVACFDTAFHASLPAQEQHFALPHHFAEAGMRRYGFHGLSYQYVMQQLQRHSAHAFGRVLMAHLGNGASLCAARAGTSLATTMGFSALDGLMMGTRSGALDPGLILHLLRQGWDVERLEHLLYQQSGLLGVSGISADMRTLRASQNPAAQFAIDLFTYRVIRECGALSACLGGLDALVFTGGIGEHDHQLRAAVASALSYLGVDIDTARNALPTPTEPLALHTASSAVEVWVVATDEGRVAAEQALALMAQTPLGF